MHIRKLLRRRGRVAAVAAAAALPLALLGAGTAGAGTAGAGAAGAGAGGPGGTHAAFKPPAIKHVWVIELENEGFGQAFGNGSPAPYLAKTLVSMGALLKNYFAVGHDSLDNYIAQVTGQAPDTATQNDCGVWNKFSPANVVRKPFDQLVGNGGLIMITFDEGSDSGACCGETLGKSASHPDVAKPGMDGPGGGRVGAVLLSPFIKPGTVSTVDYNHYSMLRSIEDLFHLSHLGDAAMPQVKSFGSDVYTKG